MTVHVDFGVFDADNHYYEAKDAFIRHVPKDMHKRCMQWAEINGKERLLVAGKINRFIPNPTWDPIAKPGILDKYFRGDNDDGQDVKTMFGELDPLVEHPEYQDRDTRLAMMTEQGVDAAFFFPTLGVGMQASLAHDIEAAMVAFHGFNQWLAEDWGFDDGRIYAAPLISLADVDAAVAEVDSVLEQGAKIVVMVPGPVPQADGTRRSPADPLFDPVWARLNEAGITVGIHGGDGGVILDYINNWERKDQMEAFRSTPFQLVVSHDRQISDTFAAMICHGLFARHPNLRIASIENGGSFVNGLLHELNIAYGKAPQDFPGDLHPVEQFKQHVWVSPYYEDDIDLIKTHIGADHILFGSDYPHAEGLAEPTAFIHDIPNFTADEARLVMRDNAFGLVQPQSALASA